VRLNCNSVTEFDQFCQPSFHKPVCNVWINLSPFILGLCQMLIIFLMQRSRELARIPNFSITTSCLPLLQVVTGDKLAADKAWKNHSLSSIRVWSHITMKCSTFVGLDHIWGRCSFCPGLSLSCTVSHLSCFPRVFTWGETSYFFCNVEVNNCTYLMGLLWGFREYMQRDLTAWHRVSAQ
jgi:hypothetical protein